MQCDRRNFIRLLASAPVIWGRGVAAAQRDARQIVLNPGDDIQQAIDANPEGTDFVLNPGIYRQQSIVPKNAQRFIGRQGAVLNGAVKLAQWKFDGRYWLHENLPNPLRSPHGKRCLTDRPLCHKREQLFINDTISVRVASPEELDPGKWFFDEDSRRALLVDDPRGKEVELTQIEKAIDGGMGKNQIIAEVQIQNLTVEKYAGIPNESVVGNEFTYGWRLTDLVCQMNQGSGCTAGPGAHILRGKFLHNGQVGMGGIGDGIVIEGAEFAFNNIWSGFNPGWAAGGTKFWNVRNFTMRNCTSHHNGGPGLWWDHECDDVLVEHNNVYDNGRQGIQYEISSNATIRRNRCSKNGRDFWKWVFGSQILIQNSKNCTVYGNYCEIHPSYGNGITMAHQARGYLSLNNVVYNNKIVHLGEQGVTGLAVDSREAKLEIQNTLSTISFDQNTYVVPDLGNHEYWGWISKGYKDWNAFRSASGQENSGIIVRADAGSD